MATPFPAWLVAWVKRAVLAAVPALLAVAPAGAQRQETVYDRVTAETVHDVLLLNGLRVLTQQVDGEQVVADNRLAVDDFSAWYVYLYNCREGEGCGDVEFRVAYSGVDASLEDMNAWNARYRFTRAYRSGDYAVLSMDINADGGVTVEAISAMVPVWRRAIARFANSLAPPPPG